MNLGRLKSRLRFLAKELVDEASRWGHRPGTARALKRAAQQCAANAITLERTYEGTAEHRAGVALHDEAINVLVDTIARRTPASIIGRNHA